MTNLVDDLMDFIGRFVVMSDDQRLVVALWVIHTHCLDAFEQTPYLAVTSPEKQCGKSRLLEVLEVLVVQPWVSILPSEAVLYRRIEQVEPTLLFDEIDTSFSPKTADKYEGHRALLNAGHRRGAKVPRCIGTSQDIAEFRVFCPKVLAGIGVLPDTIADRSIPIRLERKKRAEKVERFLIREVTPTAGALKDGMRAYGESHVEHLTERYPDMPEVLSDRMQEGTECLVAIADTLDYGRDARDALVALLTEERLDHHETMRIRLLRDLYEMFETLDGARGAPTENILDYLVNVKKESPWRNYYGRRLDAPDLAALLKHFGVKPDVIRVDSETTKRGYRRKDLQDVWDRYLTPEDDQ